jgi:shikimate dehydrogenase
MKLALIGDPVAHSQSPRIQNALLREAGIDGSYVAIRVPKGNAREIIGRLRLDGYAGLNVTTPLKEEALFACDDLAEEARLAKAVNTIFFGQTVLGTNTDGIGARIALETLLGGPVALKRIGVLGTGATARAVLAQLRETDAYTYVWARDAQKAQAVSAEMEAQSWPAVPPEIVVSALPPDASLPDPLLNDLRAAEIVMDVNYGNRSALERQVRREVVKGDVMLEAQARASFAFWLTHAQAALEGFAQNS